MMRNLKASYPVVAALILLGSTIGSAQENVTQVSDRLLESWLDGARKVEWSRAEQGTYRLKLDDHEVTLTNRRVDCLLSAAFDGQGRGELKTINTWNNRSRGTRAYLDDDGDPCLEMDIDFEGGTNEFVFHGNLDWFRLQLGRFAEEVVP
jgi:hypothetical protein